ncbi:MAG: ABC transporter ATP-binding protein [Chloroflexota bacterium]
MTPAPSTAQAGDAALGDEQAGVAIRVVNLRKAYGSNVAVANLSFDVNVGEVFALLGPNGAGKTTTIEVLEGYRRADAGEVRVLGLDPQRNARDLRRRMGLMLQDGGIYPQARPGEILNLFASFYPNRRDVGELLRVVGLTEAVKTPYRRLSGGQKQRLSLALALVGQPKLVFLDEPTAGMDPQARRATWDIIRSLRERRVTVLFTTHYMDEAEQLADRLAIVDRGELAAIGDMATLRHGTEATVRMVTDAAVDVEALRALPHASAVQAGGPTICSFETPDSPALLAELTAWARDNSVVIRELRAGRESLEEIFLRLTGEEVRA